MRTLIVEDDIDLGELLSRHLRRHYSVVDLVTNIGDALFVIGSERYDTIIVDRMLPDGDGLSLIPPLRVRQPQSSIIVLTASATIPDRVEGLDAGADDYLAKPFAIEELIARIRAVGRRGATAPTKCIEIGNLRLDPVSRATSVSNGTLALPRRELLILEALMRRVGLVVTRSSLEQAVYGLDDEIGPNALDPHVSRLRKRLLEADAAVTIHTLRGIGYMIRADER